jgi:FlaA1/EpsC-like NDP-sugar epimerase
MRKIIHNVNRSSHLKRVLFSAVMDAAIMLAAFTVVFFVRSIATDLDYMDGLGFTLLSIVITLIALYRFGVYHRVWSRTSGHDVAVIINAVAVATGILLVVDLLSGLRTARLMPLSVLLLSMAVTLMGFVAIRYQSRLVTGVVWRVEALFKGKEVDRNRSRILVVGAGESGQTFVWRMKYRWAENKNNKQYEIIGYVDDSPEKQDLYIEGCRVLGQRQDIPSIVRNHQVDLIVLAIHNVDGPDFRDILAYCESTDAMIKVVPNTLAMVNARLKVPTLRDIKPEDILGRKPIERHSAVDLSPMMGRVTLVTGAAGSIGSELSRQMATYDPIKLILLDNNESGLHDLYTEMRAKYPEMELIPALVDITNRQAVYNIFNEYQPQVVFHAAAYKHVPMLELYPYESVRVNVGGTRNLAEAARDSQVERFVMVSTDKAVDPSCVMGASKRICELIVQAIAHQPGHDTLFTAVRFGNVIGSRGSVVPTFNRQIDQGGPVTVTHKRMTRYFMTIAEAVNLVLHAACLTEGRDLFMLRMGEVVRIVELAERMIRMRGLRPYEDVPIEFTGIRPGEKLHEKLRRDAEEEETTVHPHIMKLLAPGKMDHSAAFIETLNTLVMEASSYNPALIERVTALANDTGDDGRDPDEKPYLSYLVNFINQFELNGTGAEEDTTEETPAAKPDVDPDDSSSNSVPVEDVAQSAPPNAAGVQNAPWLNVSLGDVGLQQQFPSSY